MRCCIIADFVNNGADTAERMGVDPGDVFITTMPLFHTGGCVCCVLGAVSKAATQVLLEAFDPGLVLEMFGTYRGNAHGRRSDDAGGDARASDASRPTDLSSVKAICSGGSTVPAPLVQTVRAKAQSALHDRIRPDRMLSGRGT